MRHSDPRLEHTSGAGRSVQAWAPGRVNLIGEHTDYNDGLCLPFALESGISVTATLIEGGDRIEAHAADLAENDSFPVADPTPAEGWRAYVRGAVGELRDAGVQIRGAQLEISGDLRRDAGLSSSAALTVALCLALGGAPADPIALARLCSRVENEWTGARTGLLDQVASLCGARDAALLIDFRSLEVERVPLELEGWRFAIADSGERHSHASSGYNERREECASACRLLGIDSLREADLGQLAELPQPLRDRARHVLEENARVLSAIDALRERDMPAVGGLLDASHASLRDL